MKTIYREEVNSGYYMPVYRLKIHQTLGNVGFGIKC